jgi:hypothetical protein
MSASAPPQTCPAAAATPAADTGEGGTVAVVTKAKKKLLPKFRSSYKQPDFWIRSTDLLFEVVPDPKDPAATATYVTSTLQIERNSHKQHASPPNLELDGEVSTAATWPCTDGRCPSAGQGMRPLQW